MKHDPLKITEKLISLKSYNGADEPFYYLKEILDSAGAKVEVIEHEGVKNIHAEYGKGTAVFGFNGHYDTVPPEGDWERNPLQPTIKHGKLYGLGSTDMKGGLAGMLCAFIEIGKLNPKKKIIFQAVGDEEIHGTNGTKVLVEKKKFAKRMFIGEPSGMSISNEHKSLMRVDAMMYGKSAHGSRVYTGSNAIMKMTRALQRLAVEGYLRFTCKKEEINSVTSCNVGVILGGKAPNIIPAECSAQLDIRMPRDRDPQEVIEYLKKHFDEIHILHRSNGMYTAPNHELVQTSLKVAEKVYGKKLDIRYSLGACDGRYFTKLDIPTVKGGPCGIDEKGERTLHRKDEFVPVDEIYIWKDIYQEIAMKYL